MSSAWPRKNIKKEEVIYEVPGYKDRPYV